MATTNFQPLVRAYRKRDFGFIAEFIKVSQKNANTESSLVMMTESDPFYAVCGLNAMAAAYTHGSSYDYALLYGMATYECAYHYLFKSAETRKEEMLSYAASSANFVTKSYLDTARYEEGIQFYHRVAEDFRDYFASPEFIPLQLNAVELYLASDNLETARNIFQSISSNNIPYYSRINYERLGTRIKSLFRKISITPEEAQKAESVEKQLEFKSMLNAIDNMLTQTAEGETEESKKIAQLIKELKPLIGYTEDNSEAFESATNVHSKLNSYLKTISGGGQEWNIAELGMQLHDLQAVFLNKSTAHNAAALENTLHGLQQLLPKFDKKYINETNDTLWSIHICQKRLGLPSEGAATLEALRKNLEHKRAQIHNKKERAGVFKTYQYLLPSLTELYYKSNNAKGVLKAIEASKGRLLADAIAEQTSAEIQIDNYDLPVDKLPLLLSKNRAAYISFFTYDDYSICALATSNGRFYTEKILIGKTNIQEWVNDHLDDPKEWENKGLRGLFTKKTNIPQLLEQFLNILHKAIREGNMAPGDHLVYSPDDMLFLFPLQYAMFNNKYLIEQFSLSRIHGAYQLVSILEQPPVPLKNLICCTVPAVQDLADSEKIRSFSKVKEWLAKNQQAFNEVTAIDSIDEFLRTSYINSIIHFSTHGVFPAPGIDPAKANPYYNSGLLLKDGDKLPTLDSDFNYYEKSYFLNSHKLFESDKSWQNNHITFQACVSARSKEGVGGDALGMENAAFFLGAKSMLTAGWNISIEWANDFCIRFYLYWLTEKLSKAEAYRKAMLELLKTEPPFYNSSPYYWGGMTLSGDWR